MSNNTKVLKPSGILNAISANKIRRDINDSINEGYNVILVDLEKIDFVDSSGLGALVAAAQNVNSTGGQMFICSLNEQVKMLFELTKMERIFKIFANQEEFNKIFLKIENDIKSINDSIDTLNEQVS